jgi:hypothetical protein
MFNKKGQSAGLTAFVIFAVICAGFILYFMYPAVETIRINAVGSLNNQSNPLLMLVLYSLQPILWGIWFVASTAAVIGVSR